LFQLSAQRVVVIKGVVVAAQAREGARLGLQAAEVVIAVATNVQLLTLFNRFAAAPN
jgi:hypothetical protein